MLNSSSMSTPAGSWEFPTGPSSCMRFPAHCQVRAERGKEAHLPRMPRQHLHFLLAILLYEFYIKAGSMCLKLCYCNCYLFGVVSTSPVVWSQVRQFFL